MSFLNANTPDELRVAVPDAVDPLTGLFIDLELQAANEARAFAKRYSTGWLHDQLEDDPFLFDAMRDATSGEGIAEDPEPGRAILVLANGFDMARSGQRVWTYLSDVPNGVEGLGDHLPCHRCDLVRQVEGRPRITDVIAGVFHIARGPYVVEFALCDGCLRYYERQADHVRIHNGDTYITDPLED